jgi:UDP-N-acetylmuramoylalanine--D-glutamate ligase
VVLIGQDAIQIKQAIEEDKLKPDQQQDNLSENKPSINLVETMEEAIDKAYELAVSGDLILFSPACASFDMYKNYIDRGNDFIRIVNKKVI